MYPVGDVWASYTFQAELITRVCSSEFIIVFKKNRIPWIQRVKLSNFYIPGIALDWHLKVTKVNVTKFVFWARRGIILGRSAV